MKSQNHYETLEVDTTATDAEIKAAYYRLAKIYHPDSVEISESDTEKFLEIQKAYDVLSSPLDKRDYDRKLNIHQPTHTRTYTPPPDPQPTQHEEPDYRHEPPAPDSDFQQDAPLDVEPLHKLHLPLAYQVVVSTISFCSAILLSYFIYEEYAFDFNDRTMAVISSATIIPIFTFNWFYFIKMKLQPDHVGYYAGIIIAFLIAVSRIPLESISLLAFAIIAGTCGIIIREWKMNKR